MSRFRVKRVYWFNPIRLVMKVEPDVIKFVGWGWGRDYYMVNNINHGWIAYVEDQTEDRLARCPCCKRPTRDALTGKSITDTL